MSTHESPAPEAPLPASAVAPSASVHESGSPAALAAPSPRPADAAIPSVPAVWGLSFLSGACGLIYAMLWTRQLGLSSVLAAFLGGLAFGGWCAGRWCGRVRRPLLVFGILEIGIGTVCIVLPWLMSDSGPLVAFLRSLYGDAGGPAVVVAHRATTLLLLLVPTALMGATLPLLSHGTVRSRQDLGRTAGWLYSVNTLGAVAGAALASLWLLPEWGTTSVNLAVALCNLLLGAAAIALGQEADLAPAPDPVSAGVPPLAETAAAAALPGWSDAESNPLAVQAAVASLGVTGFAALATLIGWTRAIGLGTGSTTHALGTIVSVSLLGLGLGGAWGARIAPREHDSVAFLGRLLVVIGLLCAALVTVLGYAPVLFFFLLAWTSNAEGGVQLAAQSLGIGALLFAPTFLLGATLPVALQIATRLPGGTARVVGNLYAFGTAGALVGSLLAAPVLLPGLHLQGTLGAMALLFAVSGILLFALSASRERPREIARVAAALLPCLAILLASPRWQPELLSSGLYLLRDPQRLQAAHELRLRDALPDTNDVELLYYKDGASSTVAVRRTATGLSLAIDGRPVGSDHLDLTSQALRVLLPVVLHPGEPKEILVIGFGSGVGAGAALAPSWVERVDAVEISPEVVAASERFAAVNGLRYRADGGGLETPKLTLVIHDGRSHAQLTRRTYDVISSAPSHPWLVGNGNPFTREAFQRAQDRLRPDGVLCQWIDSDSFDARQVYAVLRTFAEVFPHVHLWHAGGSDFLLLGSRNAMRLAPERLRARLADPGMRPWLERLHVENEIEFLSACQYADATLRARTGMAHPPVLTDDHARLEFSAPRALPAAGTFLASFHPDDPASILDFSGVPSDARATLLEGLDRAVRAREHLRCVTLNLGSADAHRELACRLSPGGLWSLDARAQLDLEAARRALEGAAGGGAPDPERALALLAEARKRSPHLRMPAWVGERAAVQRALDLLRQGDAEGAWKAVEGVTEPADPARLGLFRARIHAARKDAEKAMAELDRIDSSDPAIALESAEIAARLLRDFSRGDEALQVVDQALADPRANGESAAAPVWFLASLLLADAGRFSEAIAANEEALRLAPGEKTHHLNKGRLLARVGNFREAVEPLMQRAALDPRHPEALPEAARAALLAAGAESAGAGDTVRPWLSLARRLSREMTALRPEAPEGWEWTCRSFLAFEALFPEEAALHREEARKAWQTLLQRVGGDAAKAPADLAERFR